MDPRDLSSLKERYQFFQEDRNIILLSMESGVDSHAVNCYITEIEDMWKYTLSVVPSFYVLTHHPIVSQIVTELLNARNEALCLMTRAVYLPHNEWDCEALIDYDEWKSAGDTCDVEIQKSPVSSFSHEENSLFKPVLRRPKSVASGKLDSSLSLDKNTKIVSKRSRQTAFGDTDTSSECTVAKHAKIFKPVSKRSRQTAFAETKSECTVVKQAKVFNPVLKRPILDSYEMACSSECPTGFKPVLTYQDKNVLKEQRILYKAC